VALSPGYSVTLLFRDLCWLNSVAIRKYVIIGETMAKIKFSEWVISFAWNLLVAKIQETKGRNVKRTFIT